MAKSIGITMVIKQGWMKKAIALLPNNLKQEDYSRELEEHLSFEIDSVTNLHRARQILMNIWYRENETFCSLQKEGRQLAIDYPDSLTEIEWCMTALAFPAFYDICRLMGKMYEFQDTISTTQIRQKIADEWGERYTLDKAVTKIVSTMKEIGAIQSISTGRHQKIKSNTHEGKIISYIIRVAMALDGSSYYTFSSLKDFPFLFPFEYKVAKEQLMQDERFTLSTFDATLSVALDK